MADEKPNPGQGEQIKLDISGEFPALDLTGEAPCAGAQRRGGGHQQDQRAYGEAPGGGA